MNPFTALHSRTAPQSLADIGPHVIAVTGVSAHGFTLVVDGEVLRLPFNRFPWFRRARADRLSTVEWHSPNHLFWPRLNVELSLHFIRLLATVSADGP